MGPLVVAYSELSLCKNNYLYFYHSNNNSIIDKTETDVKHLRNTGIYKSIKSITFIFI